MFDRDILRGGSVRNITQECCIASWNVEGLTEEKLVTLQVMMAELHVDILCLQEVHRTKSDYFITESKYLVIISGSATESKENAGVGFIVAPHIRSAVLGFCQLSNRMCALKFK